MVAWQTGKRNSKTATGGTNSKIANIQKTLKNFFFEILFSLSEQIYLQRDPELASTHSCRPRDGRRQGRRRRCLQLLQDTRLLHHCSSDRGDSRAGSPVVPNYFVSHGSRERQPEKVGWIPSFQKLTFWWILSPTWRLEIWVDRSNVNYPLRSRRKLFSWRWKVFFLLVGKKQLSHPMSLYQFPTPTL